MKKFRHLIIFTIFLLSFNVNVFGAARENSVSGVLYNMNSNVFFVEKEGISHNVNNSDFMGIGRVETSPVLNIYLNEDVKNGDRIKIRIPEARWQFIDGSNNINTSLAENIRTFTVTDLYNLIGLMSTYETSEGEYVGNSYYKKTKYDSLNDYDDTPRRPEDEYLYEFNTSTGELSFSKSFSKGTTISLPILTYMLVDTGNSFTFGNTVDKTKSFYVEVISDLDAVQSGQYLFATTYGTNKEDTPPLIKTSSTDFRSLDYQKAKELIYENKNVEFELNAGEVKKEIGKDIIGLLKDGEQPFKVTNRFISASIPYQVFSNASKVSIEFVKLNLQEETKAALYKMDNKNSSLINFMYRIVVKVDDKEVQQLTAPLTIGFNYDNYALTDNQKNKLSVIRFTNSLLSKYEFLGGKHYPNNSVDVRFQYTGDFGIAITDETAKITEYAVNASQDKKEPAEVVKEEEKTTIFLKVGDKSYTVNGETMTADVAPEIIKNYTYVPIRFVAEALNAEVGWDKLNNMATIALGDVKLQMTANQTIPGMDFEPLLIDGRLMIPLRYVSEQLKASVDWNSDERSIIITKSLSN